MGAPDDPEGAGPNMSTTTTSTGQLDTGELEQRVRKMYEEVALEPEQEFHFETGRPLAERLGYDDADLDRIPAAAVDSFAGVGYFLDLAAVAPGESVLRAATSRRGCWAGARPTCWWPIRGSRPPSG